MMLFAASALTLLPAITAAHFLITYPPGRGTVDDGEYTYPCAGYAQTQNRTTISSTAFPLVLDLHHTHSLISVFLGLGNESPSFAYQLQPTVQEVGPGDFCFPGVPIPRSLNISDGTNGTVQVVTDGETGGGLYMCADVTFTTTSVQNPSSCINGTGLTASPVANVLANGTGSASGSSTSMMPSVTNSHGAAATMTAALGIVGAGVLGVVALL